MKLKIIVSSVALTSVILGGAIFQATYAKESINKPANSRVELMNENLYKSKLNAYKEKDHSLEIEVDVMIPPKETTPEALAEHRKAMPKMFSEIKAKGKENTPVVVTFSEALTFAEFEEFLKDNKGVTLTHFSIRTVDQTGNKGVIGGVPEAGVVINKNKVDKFLNDMPAGTKVVGVGAFEGELKVDGDNFNQLYNDDRVYIADISASIAEDKVKAGKKYKELKQKNNKHHVDVNVIDYFWDVEKFTEENSLKK